MQVSSIIIFLFESKIDKNIKSSNFHICLRFPLISAQPPVENWCLSCWDRTFCAPGLSRTAPACCLRPLWPTSRGRRMSACPPAATGRGSWFVSKTDTILNCLSSQRSRKQRSRPSTWLLGPICCARGRSQWVEDSGAAWALCAFLKFSLPSSPVTRFVIFVFVLL